MNTANAQEQKKPGQLDPAFGTQGVVFLDYPDGRRIYRPADMVLTSSGRILLAGTAVDSEPTGSKFALARFYQDGSKDKSFGTDGLLVGQFTPGYDARGLAPILLRDGGIILMGSQTHPASGISYRALARFSEDGLLDTSFGNDGYVVLDLPLFQDGKPLGKPAPARAGDSPPDFRHVTGSDPLIADEKIIVSDDYGPTTVTFRLNLDGTLDTTFNEVGYVAMAFANATTSLAQPLQLGSKITSAGSVNYLDEGRVRPLLVRYTDEGQLDTSLNDSGYLVVPAGQNEAPSSQYAAIARYESGRLLAAGSTLPFSTDTQGLLALHTAGGDMDPQFNGGSPLFATIGTSGCQLYKVAIAPDTSHIVTVGSTLGRASTIIGRLDLSGKWDTGFGDGQGWVLINIGSDTNIPFGLTLQPDGNILVSCGQIQGNFSFLMRIQG